MEFFLWCYGIMVGSHKNFKEPMHLTLDIKKRKYKRPGFSPAPFKEKAKPKIVNPKVKIVSPSTYLMTDYLKGYFQNKI